MHTKVAVRNGINNGMSQSKTQKRLKTDRSYVTQSQSRMKRSDIQETNELRIFLIKSIFIKKSVQRFSVISLHRFLGIDEEGLNKIAYAKSHYRFHRSSSSSLILCSFLFIYSRNCFIPRLPSLKKIVGIRQLQTKRYHQHCSTFKVFQYQENKKKLMEFTQNLISQIR